MANGFGHPIWVGCSSDLAEPRAVLATVKTASRRSAVAFGQSCLPLRATQCSFAGRDGETALQPN